MDDRWHDERISVDDHSGVYDYTLEIDGTCFLTMMIGQEPVRYVRNIFKYHVAYKLEEEARAQRDRAMEKT